MTRTFTDMYRSYTVPVIKLVNSGFWIEHNIYPLMKQTQSELRKGNTKKLKIMLDTL
jgi:hypothetical protein